ncbi:MAG TPA: YdeI/OmpD-associated family protein, partial [Segetibacter sp.]
MVTFSATIKRFNEQGEKTGWTYIEVTEAIATQLMPGNKKAFRVKGLLDNYVFEGMSLIPMGGGNFILPLNAQVRKYIGKSKGAVLIVKMEVDTKPELLSPDLMQCLRDEPAALAYFNTLAGSHQKYFSRWIESAKTEETKAKRIAQTVTACARSMGYGEMLRSLK